MTDGDKTGLASLKDADWLTRKSTQAVFDALSGEGIETRAVGGAVRNAFLKLPVAEVDLATTATPQEVIALAEKAGLKAVPTGIEHGTVTVIADGAPFEVTTLRRDVETFGRHAEVAFTRDWEADAKRRDFTLNALYANRQGCVFDPLHGYADLAAGRVRFIGDAAERIREDYLRILRFFRFNAYYGRGPLDEAGLMACVTLRGGLAQLSAERIWTELKRILVAPRAAEAIEALFDYGLLTEILGGVPRLMDFGRLAAIEIANGLAANAPLRLAVLAIFVDEDVARIAERLRLSNAGQAVLALAADVPEGLPQEAFAKAALYSLAENYRSAILIAWARSGDAAEDARWIEALKLPDRWQVPEFPVRGQDIMALGIAGTEVGTMLRRLEQEWIEGGFAATRERLLDRAGTLIRS
jgi:tRNA nucleotidyltransferase/poly(A) polymerase